MSIQLSSQRNINHCSDAEIGQIYEFLDPRSALAFSQADKRTQSIFHTQLPTLIKIQCGHPFRASMPKEEQFLRLALTKVPYPNAICERTLREHQGIVQMNADGSKVLSIPWNFTPRLWDLDAGIYIKTLRGHGALISCMHMSADGTTALTGSADHTLKLWDLETGECIRTLQGHTSWINCVYMNADGTKALSGSHPYDNTLKVWDLKTGECIRTLQGHAGGVSHAQMSADGTRALSVSPDETMKLWDLETGECIRTLQGHTSSINCMEINADWTKALSGSEDNTLKLWDLRTGECLKTLQGHTHWVTCTQISADWTKALSGSRDKTLKLWDLQTGECIKTLQGHTHWVTCMQMTPDATKALSGSSDHSLKLWDLQTGECIKTLRHTGGVSCLQINAGWTRALSRSPYNMKVWNLTPLPEECVCDVRQAILRRDPRAQENLKQLPLFVRQALLDVKLSETDRQIAHIEDHILDTTPPHILDRNFNRYIAREFLPPIAKLFQDTVLKRPNMKELPIGVRRWAYDDPETSALVHPTTLDIRVKKFVKAMATSKTCHDSAYRRFAKLPDDVKRAVFRALSESKGLTYDAGQLAFYDRDGNFPTHQEKADAIHRVAQNASQFIF